MSYAVQGCSMHCGFHDLDGSVVANVGGEVCGEWDLREAEAARVWFFTWTGDFEHGYHG